MKTEPAIEVFSRNYERGEAQVVWTTLVADLETPVSAFLKIAGGKPMQRDTICRVYSMTKIVTAVAVVGRPIGWATFPNPCGATRWRGMRFCWTIRGRGGCRR